MPDAATPARMFVRGPTSYSARRQTITLPLVTALVEPGSGYSSHDPREAPPPPKPKPAVPAQRGRPRGPTAETLEKLWHEANGERAAFKRALDARLRKCGLMSR